MEDLLARQNNIIESIIAIKTNFGKDSASRKTPEYLQRRINALNEFWKEFEQNHQRLSLECEDKNVVYYTENHFERTKEMYHALQHTLLSYQKQDKATITPSPAVTQLLSKQRTNFRALSRLMNSINPEEISEKWELEDELRKIQSRWNIIETQHLEIDDILQGEDLEYEVEFTAYEREFKNVKRALNRRLSSTAHIQHSTPQLEIPIFTGKYSQWPTFYDLFSEAIHNNNSLTSSQKMQHLKGKVKGEAERLIQHLHISSENYVAAWDILVHRYDNKQLLFTNQIETLLNQPNVQKQSAYEIKRIHDTSVECIHAIHNLGVDTNTWDPLLVHLLSKKLDCETLKDYKEARKSPRDLPALQEFISFLETKFTALEPMHKKEREITTPSSLSKHVTNPRSPFYSAKNFNHDKYQGKTYHTRAMKCPVCNFNHNLFQCRKFINTTPAAKLKIIAKYQVCKNCLYKHYENPCLSTKRCKECKGDHNSLLHEAFVNNTEPIPSTSQQRPENNVSENKQNIKQHNVNYVAGENEEILLTTVLLKVLSDNGTFITLRALLDQGSQISLISENAVQMLGLQRHKYHASVSGIGHGSKQSRGMVNIECHSIYGDYSFTTQALIISRVINNLPNNSFTKKSWSHLQHIDLADPDYNVSGPIDLLLDASVYSQILMDGLIRGPSQSPIAQQTRMGWILSGNVKTFSCNVVINDVSDLSKYWKMEEISASDTNMSSGEQFCEDFYSSTTKRLENGMYEVCLPMKPDFEKQLGSSRPKAVAQFYQMERKMASKMTFSASYKDFMQEYQDLGHMVPSTKTEGPSCYLPHHGVLKLDSTSTKLRVVFNASSKTSTGQSLNDVMEQGPNLQADLQTLIITWRQHRYVMTADIEKMFRKIFVRYDYQKLQSIVWRNSGDEPLLNYQLSTVTYGVKAAPFLAMRTLRQLALDDAEKYPLGAAALNNSFYMDDYLGGHFSLEIAKEIQTQLINILRGAGMNIRKWSSNEEELVKDLSSNQLNSPYEFRCSESRKTLGLKWNPSSDSFTYDNKFEESVLKRHTKREFLSDISKIFDPIGWISPLSIKAKLLFQKVWATGVSWDEELPSDIIREWTVLRNEFKNITNIEIPRYLGNIQHEYHIHGFSDASAKAYACAIYCVTTDNKGERTSRLIAAKTKLAPLSKTVSLPRLELAGALILTQLMKKIKEALPSENIYIHAWTDSMIVLGWIHGDQSRWKQFVANRIQQIKEVIPPTNWNYVQSEANPADCATRGVTIAQLSENRLWWEGPEWLLSSVSENISEVSYVEPDIEIKKIAHSVNAALYQNQSELIIELLNKYSSITFIVRILARVLRFITGIRNRCNMSSDKALLLNELNNSYNIIIKTVQAMDFSKELSDIRQKGHVHKNSKLASLSPFIDENGLLRVGGRLDHSDISWSAKHPIILSGHNRFTELIIQQAHITTLHGGARLTLSYIRNKYWIVSGMSTVKRELRRCVRCRRFSQNKYQPIMADLPQPRVVPSRLFANCGIDFTGYVDLKINKGRGVRTSKGYISVFICLSTKAVHLELVSDLSTPSFLAAFRRFCSRRGVPGHVYSDNGTNFVGANKLLKREYQEIKATINKDFFDNIAEMNVEWHFNAPSYPHAGGLWEAAVKSLKFHIKRVIGEQKLTYEEFITVLHQVEACLNSRPLCALTENPEDPVLTPGHFLIGGQLLTKPQTEPDSITLSKRWQLVQSINKQFWKCWSSDYLQQLQLRSKWRTPSKNIDVNDIVLVKEDNLPPGKWAMGRVQELHPGKDGQVRVVSLKTKNNIIKRPVIKLVPLVTQEQGEEPTSSSPSSEEPLRPRPRRTKRNVNLKNFLLSLFMFLSFFVSPSIQQGQQDFIITPINNNQTIYFDRISNIQHIRDEWNLVIYYNMSTYWDGLYNIQKYVTHIKESCSSNDYQGVILQLEHELDEIDHYNQLLRNQFSRRLKRGLVNGVGYIANSLFGILDERFADQYQKDIERIQKNENHLQTLLHNQTIVMEAEYNILKRHENIMQKQFSLIEDHLNNVTAQLNQVRLVTSQSTYITYSSLAAHIIISNIRRIQETLISTVTDINDGRINTNLLSPQQLQKQINIISGRLQGDLVLPLDGSNIIHFYKLLRVAARVTDKFLIIEIKIPVLNNEVFELDEIISILQKREDQYYHLIQKYPYIGFNINKDSLIFLSDLDLQACRHFSTEKLLCFLNNPIYSTKIKQSICDINLIDGGSDSSPCKSEVSICKESWIKLHADNEWLFTCCEQCSVRIICPAGITSQTMTGSGVIHLGPMCTLKGNDFVLHSHNYYSNKVNINQRLEIPHSSVLNDIMNTSSINIPRLESHEEDWDLLKAQISDVKEQSNTELRIHDVHHYSLGYIIVGLLVLTAGIIVFRRLRLRRARQPAGAEASRDPREGGTAATTNTGATDSVSEVFVNMPRKSDVSDVVVNVPGIKNTPSEIRQSVLSIDKSTSISPMTSRSVRFDILED